MKSYTKYKVSLNTVVKYEIQTYTNTIQQVSHTDDNLMLLHLAITTAQQENTLQCVNCDLLQALAILREHQSSLQWTASSSKKDADVSAARYITCQRLTTQRSQMIWRDDKIMSEQQLWENDITHCFWCIEESYRLSTEKDIVLRWCTRQKRIRSTKSRHIHSNMILGR